MNVWSNKNWRIHPPKSFKTGNKKHPKKTSLPGYRCVFSWALNYTSLYNLGISLQVLAHRAALQDTMLEYVGTWHVSNMLHFCSDVRLMCCEDRIGQCVFMFLSVQPRMINLNNLFLWGHWFAQVWQGSQMLMKRVVRSDPHWFAIHKPNHHCKVWGVQSICHIKIGHSRTVSSKVLFHMLPIDIFRYFGL